MFIIAPHFLTHEAIRSIRHGAEWSRHGLIFERPMWPWSLTFWPGICVRYIDSSSWWRHQMETFSALLAICAGKPLVPGEFPAQRPVMRSFGVIFDLRLYKRLSKPSWGWWFETLLRLLWSHCNVGCIYAAYEASRSNRHGTTEQTPVWPWPFDLE